MSLIKSRGVYMLKIFSIMSRILLGLTYLWVVGDRLGLLGEAGNMGVVWGNFQSFLDYTATLNPWFPRGLSDFLGYLVTGIEIILGVMFLIGMRLRLVSLASLGLLIIFTLSMLLSLGWSSAYDFIIFTLVLASLSLGIWKIERVQS